MTPHPGGFGIPALLPELSWGAQLLQLRHLHVGDVVSRVPVEALLEASLV